MRKAYIQPEAELISLASLEDILQSGVSAGGNASDWNDGNEGGNEGGNDYEDKWD